MQHWKETRKGLEKEVQDSLKQIFATNHSSSSRGETQNTTKPCDTDELASNHILLNPSSFQYKPHTFEDPKSSLGATADFGIPGRYKVYSEEEELHLNSFTNDRIRRVEFNNQEVEEQSLSESPRSNVEQLVAEYKEFSRRREIEIEKIDKPLIFEQGARDQENDQKGLALGTYQEWTKDRVREMLGGGTSSNIDYIITSGGGPLKPKGTFGVTPGKSKPKTTNKKKEKPSTNTKISNSRKTSNPSISKQMHNKSVTQNQITRSNLRSHIENTKRPSGGIKLDPRTPEKTKTDIYNSLLHSNESQQDYMIKLKQKDFGMMCTPEPKSEYMVTSNPHRKTSHHSVQNNPPKNGPYNKNPITDRSGGKSDYLASQRSSKHTIDYANASIKNYGKDERIAHGFREIPANKLFSEIAQTDNSRQTKRPLKKISSRKSSTVRSDKISNLAKSEISDNVFSTNADLLQNKQLTPIGIVSKKLQKTPSTSSYYKIEMKKRMLDKQKQHRSYDHISKKQQPLIANQNYNRTFFGVHGPQENVVNNLKPRRRSSKSIKKQFRESTKARPSTASKNSRAMSIQSAAKLKPDDPLIIAATDRLYKCAFRRKNEIEELKKQVDGQRHKEEMSECTFQPNITKTLPKYIDNFRGSSINADNSHRACKAFASISIQDGKSIDSQARLNTSTFGNESICPQQMVVSIRRSDIEKEIERINKNSSKKLQNEILLLKKKAAVAGVAINPVRPSESSNKNISQKIKPVRAQALSGWNNLDVSCEKYTPKNKSPVRDFYTKIKESEKRDSNVSELKMERKLSVGLKTHSSGYKVPSKALKRAQSATKRPKRLKTLDF